MIPSPSTLKPKVRYLKIPGKGIKKGNSAIVFPLDHPNPFGLVTNTKEIQTSTVIRYNTKTKEFETLNTIYVYAGEKQ